MSETILRVTWEDVRVEAERIAARWMGAGLVGVHGIPQGGAVPAVMVAQLLHVPIVDAPAPGVLVVDDLVDSGRTLTLTAPGHFHDALYRKPWSPPHLAPEAREVTGWVAFPWERDDGDPTDAVRRLLQHVGEDPNREGLLDTPKRVTRAWRQMTRGYAIDPADLLCTTFEVGPVDEMVTVAGITFTSLCEHHVLPFTGTATVAYVPGERVVGLSKLARLVDAYACRLQVQERMTTEIADAIIHHLQPRGCGVIVKASHSCMGHRGVMKPGATMVTTALRGLMKEDDAARSEFLGYAHNHDS